MPQEFDGRLASQFWGMPSFVELVMEVLDIGDMIYVKLGDPAESSVTATHFLLNGSGFWDHVHEEVVPMDPMNEV